MSRFPELLTIEVGEVSNGEVILSLCGELDLSNASSVLAHVINCDLAPGDSLVLDLSGVTFVDSSGLIALLHADDYLGGRACSFALPRSTKPVRRVLELAGLTESFNITGGDNAGSDRLAKLDGRAKLPAGSTRDGAAIASFAADASATAPGS